MKGITIIATPTQKEIELVQHYCNGLRAADISEKSGISRRTIEGFTEKTRAKYGLKTTPQLCAVFCLNGLIK